MRSLSLATYFEIVPRDEDVIGSLNAEHLDPYQRRSHHDGMHAIDTDCIHALQPA